MSERWQAIETVWIAIGCAHPITGKEHDAVDAAPDALARLADLADAAWAFYDDKPLVSEEGVERLRVALARVRAGATEETPA